MLIPAARPQFGPEEGEAVARVLNSGQLAQGDEVDAFEEEFSRSAVDGRHCIAVNSGTSALHLIMLAIGIGAGDEVLVPSFTFAATANAVALTGARPVFVDISADTFCIDPEDFASRITDRTRAVVPVHLYGHPAPMPAISEIAERAGLRVIEDAAQAHLATVNGRPVGTWGDAAAFSFYPTKNMTCGEGGMVVTGDEGLARMVRLLRNQGQEVRYRNEVVGLNNRMTDLHAAIGRVQLRKLPGWTEDRRARAALYTERLRGIRDISGPRVRSDARHVYHQYTVRIPSDRRANVVERLSQVGIGTGIYYPTPVHQLPSFNTVDYLPATSAASGEVLSLPVYPSLSLPEQEFVIAELSAAIEGS